MHKPHALLHDAFSLAPTDAQRRRTVLALSALTYVPKPGDRIMVDEEVMDILEVSNHQQRSCLTTRPLGAMGDISVLVDHPLERVQKAFSKTHAPRVEILPHTPLPWHFCAEDVPEFTQLNQDWNAHPNTPDPQIAVTDTDLEVQLKPNHYQFRAFAGVERITLQFYNCARYRLTALNDHGWYGGQCRFSGLAPNWGEFYEITGNSRDDLAPTPWIDLQGSGTRHFHFYLRDETLEVKADQWELMSDQLI